MEDFFWYSFPIQGIPDDRKSDACQMDANLMADSFVDGDQENGSIRFFVIPICFRSLQLLHFV